MLIDLEQCFSMKVAPAWGGRDASLLSGMAGPGPCPDARHASLAFLATVAGVSCKVQFDIHSYNTHMGSQ